MTPAQPGAGREELTCTRVERDSWVDLARENAVAADRYARENAALIAERDALKAETAALRTERDTLARENDHLRASLANGSGPCAYCSLPREDWSKCASGFPGCARGDDAMLCPHVGDSFGAEAALAAAEARAERAEAALEASEYLTDRYRACWLGKRVRDLPEAEAAYKAVRAALATPTPASEGQADAQQP